MLLGKLAQRVPVSLRRTRGNSESLLDARVVGSEEDTLRGLDRQHAVSRCEVEPIRHVLGEGRADRSTRLAQLQILDHAASGVNRFAWLVPTTGSSDQLGHALRRCASGLALTLELPDRSLPIEPVRLAEEL